MSAGAIVPIGPHGFSRDAAKFFPRRVTPGEVDEALKQLTTTGGVR
jgi:hypothetical protein